MRTAARRSFFCATLALVACGPLIGLEDLHDRPAASALTPDSSGDGPIDGGGGTDAGDAAPQCTTHADCNMGGSTTISLCAEGECREVNRKFCQYTLLPTRNVNQVSPLQKPNPLVIAAFTPSTGTYGSTLSYELALEELDLAGGLPLGDKKRYDVALLQCASEPDVSRDALDHVVNYLKLPAVIANFPSDTFLSYLSDITIPAGVFVLNPNVTPEPIKRLDTKGTVLGLLGPLEDVALAYRPLVDEMSKAQRARKGLPDDAPLKIVVVQTTTTAESDMVGVIQLGGLVPATGTHDPNTAIAVNGTSPVDAGASFRIERIAPLVPGQDLPHYLDLANKLAADPPDLIIALTGQEIENLVPEVESALINAAKANPDAGTVEEQKILPIWILGPRNADRPKLLDWVRGDNDETTATRLGRFRGIQYASSADKSFHDLWHLHMSQRYQPDGGPPPADYEATENFYDAVYWLAYGFYRGKRYDTSATDRVAFKEGVRRLFEGTAVVRPGGNDEIAYARALLDLNDAVYTGALGPPNIDKQFETWRGEGTVFCYDTEGGGAAKKGVVKYDAQRFLPDGGISNGFSCTTPK